MTAMRLPWLFVSMLFSKVVLPEPKNPVMTYDTVNFELLLLTVSAEVYFVYPAKKWVHSVTTDRDRNLHDAPFDVNHACFRSSGRGRPWRRLLLRRLWLAAFRFSGFLLACFAFRRIWLAGAKSLGLTEYASVLQTTGTRAKAQRKALSTTDCCVLAH